MSGEEPDFLTAEDVLLLHEGQLAAFGGADGIRDIGALDSATAMPQATFDGRFVHRDLFDMAAAYAFHVAQNHPFVDGNKRTGLAAALVFLDLHRAGSAPSRESGRRRDSTQGEQESQVEAPVSMSSTRSATAVTRRRRITYRGECPSS